MAIANLHRKMTEDEFMRLPDDGRKYELVDGEPKEVPANVRHDEIGARLCFMFYPFTRGRGALVSSQAGFRMRDGNIRCPDVSFTRKERLPGGKAPDTFGDAAPDLCIEIISLSEDKPDMTRKIEEYFDAGAKQVWHLFPETESLTVFTSPSDTVTYSANEEISGGDLLPGFRCRVAELFLLE